MAESILLLAIITLICAIIIAYNNNNDNIARKIQEKNNGNYQSQNSFTLYRNDRLKCYNNDCHYHYHQHHTQNYQEKYQQKQIENDKEMKRIKGRMSNSYIINNTIEKNNPHLHRIIEQDALEIQEKKRLSQMNGYKHVENYYYMKI